MQNEEKRLEEVEDLLRMYVEEGHMTSNSNILCEPNRSDSERLQKK